MKSGYCTVQFCSVTQSCLTVCDPMDCSTPGLPVHHQLLEFTQTHVHQFGDAIQLSHPLSPLLLPSIFPSIRVFSNESVLCSGGPKYWHFSLSISPSNKHSGLISFRMDWLDFLAVQGTLKSLLQDHSSKASILQCSAFFIVQLSHPYMTIGKIMALTRWTFVGKLMSLLFNMLSAAAAAKSLQSCPILCDPIDDSTPGSPIPGILQARTLEWAANMLSRLVINFPPRSKHLLISWLQSPFAVILEPPQNKICHCFHCFPTYLP